MSTKSIIRIGKGLTHESEEWMLKCANGSKNDNSTGWPIRARLLLPAVQSTPRFGTIRHQVEPTHTPGGTEDPD